MSGVSKLLPALLAGALVISVGDGASTEPKRLPSEPALVARMDGGGYSFRVVRTLNVQP
jgi:fructose-specific phosphotransferase system IIC component